MTRMARSGWILVTVALIMGTAGCGTSRSGLRPVDRPPEVDIRGRIQTPEGPALRAFVVLKPVGSFFKAYTRWTLSDGTFEFQGVPPAEYTIDVSLDGFAPVRQRRNFQEGGGAVEITLQPLDLELRKRREERY